MVLLPEEAWTDEVVLETRAWHRAEEETEEEAQPPSLLERARRLFHLPGRHDQRTHGRRGAGARGEAPSYTGRVEIKDITSSYSYGAWGRLERNEKHIFGRRLSPIEWQRLSGASDGAKLYLDAGAGAHGATISMMVSDVPGVRNASSTVSRYGEAPPELHYSYLRMDAQAQARGTAAAMIPFGILQAKALGIGRIVTDAAGSRSDRYFTGYHAWPRLGFDAQIPGDIKARAPLPGSVAHAHRLSELFLDPSGEGEAWWKRYGEGLHVEFDLTPGSRSWEVFERYRRRVERIVGSRIEVPSPSPYLSPMPPTFAEPRAFHLPGRHDQRLHGRRGAQVHRGLPSFTGRVRMRHPYARAVNSTGVAERHIFGRALSPVEWQRLTGAVDGSTITFSGDTDSVGSMVSTSVEGPGIMRASSTITRYNHESLPSMHYGSLRMTREAQATGLAMSLIPYGILQAKALGMGHISTSAAGSRNDPHYTGYFAWPRLGFDAEIPYRIKHKAPLPSGVAHARRISELFLDPNGEGEGWWKRYGEGQGMEFDLTTGSRSWEVFERYRRRVERALGGTIEVPRVSPYLSPMPPTFAEERAFHLPGRHDQRLHGRRGPGISLPRVSFTGDYRLRVVNGSPWSPEEFFQRLTGRAPDSGQMQRLLGAPDGSSAVLRIYYNSGRLAATATVDGVPGLRTAVFTMGESLMHGGAPRIWDVAVEFKPQEAIQVQGRGFRAISEMIRTAGELGFQGIDVLAGGNNRINYTGYFTWPRMGFDGPLGGLWPPRNEYTGGQVAIPERLRGARRLSDLMTDREGIALWKRYGSNIQASFDLTPGSRSWEVFNFWQRTHERALSGTSEGFHEPRAFHLPGRHDQRLHGRRGVGSRVAAPSYTGRFTLSTTDETLSKAELDIFGRRLSPVEWQRLTGAVDGSRLVLYPSWSGGRISVNVTDAPGIESANSTIYMKRWPGERAAVPSMHYGLLRATPQGQASGAAMAALPYGILQAARVGIKKIDTEAAGDRRSQSYTGYFAWPRLGFDARIAGLWPPRDYSHWDGIGDPPIAQGVPSELMNAKRLSELFLHPQGEGLWKRYGTGMPMVFDLTPGSRSWEVFERYRRRVSRALGEDIALPPDQTSPYLTPGPATYAEARAFHHPGRHDQKTHGRRGPGIASSRVSYTGRVQIEDTRHNAGRLRLSQEQIFGRELEPTEWQRLTGAIDGATLYLDAKDSSIATSVRGVPGLQLASMHISRSSVSSKSRLYYGTLLVQPEARSTGTAFKLIPAGIEEAARLGIGSLHTSAIGRWGSAVQGYLAWPRMGFDADLSGPYAELDWYDATKSSNLPDRLRSVNSLAELMLAPGGEGAWRRYGSSVDCTFDLTPGSRSWEVYERWKHRVDRVEARSLSEPQSFHLPGRHDQRLHGRRGAGSRTARVDVERYRARPEWSDYLSSIVEKVSLDHLSPELRCRIDDGWAMSRMSNHQPPDGEYNQRTGLLQMYSGLFAHHWNKPTHKTIDRMIYHELGHDVYINHVQREQGRRISSLEMFEACVEMQDVTPYAQDNFRAGRFHEAFAEGFSFRMLNPGMTWGSASNNVFDKLGV